MRFSDKPTDPMRSWRDRVASARACAHLAQECARAPKLDELPQDALREILAHLKVPLALKLTCRAVRAAAPERTVCSSSHALHPIHFFKWAYANGLKITHGVVTAAARQGDLEALLFMQALGQPRYDDNVNRIACPVAAECGHLHILERFMKVGTTPRDCLARHDVLPILNWAAYGGHKRVVQWILQTHATELKHPVPSTMQAAARGGQLELMKWLHFDLNYSWNGGACSMAAGNGHLHVLKWLYHEARSDNVVATTAAWDHQGPWPAEMISRAARGGHLHVLVWINGTIAQLGSVAREGMCDEAARIGRLDILKYAHAKHVTITADAAVHASNMGHVHILEWMRSTFAGKNPLGYRSIASSSFTNAAQCGRLAVLKWAHSHGFLHNPSRLFKGASAYVQDETAAWLLETFGRDACFGDTPTPTPA